MLISNNISDGCLAMGQGSYRSWNLIVGHGKSWKIIVFVVHKLLQELKQGQNKIQACYVRKYLKTRVILIIFESGS